MDPSDDFLLRLVSEEDIEYVREWITPAERSVLFAIRAGINVKPAQVAKTFAMTRYAAVRLIERIRAGSALSNKFVNSRSIG